MFENTPQSPETLEQKQSRLADIERQIQEASRGSQDDVSGLKAEATALREEVERLEQQVANPVEKPPLEHQRPATESSAVRLTQHPRNTPLRTSTRSAVGLEALKKIKKSLPPEEKRD